MTMKELVKKLQEKYNLFPVHYDAVLKGAEELEKYPEKKEWVKKQAEEYGRRTFRDCRDMELPEFGVSLVDDMLALFMLLPNVESMVEQYKKRGLPYDKALEQIDGCITAVQRRRGREGIDRRYFDWLANYFKCMIFQGGVFRVEVGIHKRPAMVLRHCCTGRYEIMMTDGTYHRSGNVLGSAGCTDTEGSFEADFCETETEYTGCLAKNGLVSPVRVTLSKKEWEVYLKQGDATLSLHIPKGAELTRENIQSSVKEAWETAKKVYPEYDIKAVHCYSWLLNPKLAEIVGENSKIGIFGSSFLRYPSKTDGMDVFGFVFPQMHDGYETLPENTRLERGLKKLYMEGGYLLNTAGVIPGI